jgi:hypothetical protein
MSVSEVSGDHCTSTKEDTNVGAPGYCGGRRGGRLAAMRVPDPELPRTIDGLVLGDGSQMSQLTARRALSAHCLEGKKTGRTRPTGSSQTHKHRVRLAACIGRQNAAQKMMPIGRDKVTFQGWRPIRQTGAADNSETASLSRSGAGPAAILHAPSGDSPRCSVLARKFATPGTESTREWNDPSDFRVLTPYCVHSSNTTRTGPSNRS